jgi:hypothetical protein
MKDVPAQKTADKFNSDMAQAKLKFEQDLVQAQKIIRDGVEELKVSQQQQKLLAKKNNQLESEYQRTITELINAKVCHLCCSFKNLK